MIGSYKMDIEAMIACPGNTFNLVRDMYTHVGISVRFEEPQHFLKMNYLLVLKLDGPKQRKLDTENCSLHILVINIRIFGSQLFL